MKSCYLLLSFCLLVSLAACGLSAEQQATMTVASWTPTATPPPTATITPSPTPLPMIGSTNCSEITELRHFGDGAFNVLLYSPDGAWLAAATTTGVSLYDAAKLEQVWTTATEANLEQIAFSKDGTSLTGVDSSLRIYAWQTSDGKQLLSKELADIDEAPMSFALSSDGAMLAVPYYDDSIHMYQTSDGSLANKIEQFLSFGEMLFQIAYSPDGSRLATISFNGDLRLWDVPGNRLLTVLESDNVHQPYGLKFSPDGKALAVNFKTESGEKSIRMLNVYSASWMQTLEGEMTVFAPDKSILDITSDGIILREYSRGDTLKTLLEQKPVQGQPAFSPDGASLAVGTSDGIRVWKWDDATLAGTISGQYPAYTGLAMSADGLTLAGGVTGGIELRKFDDGSLVRFLKTGDDQSNVFAVAYSPKGDLVAGATNSKVYVWRVEEGTLAWSLENDPSPRKLAFSPDGSMLAAAIMGNASNHGTSLLPIWNTADGSLMYTLEGSSSTLVSFIGFTDLIFSMNNNSLIAAEGGGNINAWQLPDGTLASSVSSEGLFGWELVIAASPDGQYFASGGLDRQVRHWKIGSNKPTTTIDIKDDSVTALAYSPDGKMIALGISKDIRLWQVNGGAIVCSVKGSRDTVKAIFFTPDGQFLVSLAEDGIVRIWGTP